MAGPGAVGSVHGVDTLPAELTNGQWTCSSQPPALCPNANGVGSIDQTTAGIPNGALLEYSLLATPGGTVGAFITNSVTATSPDPGVAELGPPGNSTASDTDPIVGVGIFTSGFEDAGRALSAP